MDRLPDGIFSYSRVYCLQKVVANQSISGASAYSWSIIVPQILARDPSFYLTIIERHVDVMQVREGLRLRFTIFQSDLLSYCGDLRSGARLVF